MIFSIAVTEFPKSVFSDEQMSSNFRSLLTLGGMRVNAGASILLNIIPPHICLCMPALASFFFQVSNASSTDSDEAPLKMGN